jgi:hypothetical protein
MENVFGLNKGELFINYELRTIILEQSIMLKRISAERMGINREEFLDFLQNLGKEYLKKGDPPGTAYWEKCQEAYNLARLARDQG